MKRADGRLGTFDPSEVLRVQLTGKGATYPSTQPFDFDAVSPT